MAGSPITRESDLERYLVREVKSRGGLCYKFVSPARAGVPDRIVLMGGRVGFIELKAPGKKPTLLQARELQRIADHGGVAWWASSRDDIEEFLHELEGRWP